MEWTVKKSHDFKKSTLSREVILKPYIREALGKLQDKRVLEIGCGNGYWSRFLSEAGVKEYVGLDSSQAQIELATRSNEASNVRFERGDGSTYSSKEQVEVIFIDHVLSEMDDLSEVENIVKKSFQNLKNCGRLVLLEAHPSVLDFRFSSVQSNNDYHYFSENSPIIAQVEQPSGNSFEIHDYHRTLGFFSQLLTRNGFTIDNIMEPRYTGSSQNEYLVKRSRCPSHIIISAKKV